MGVLAYVSARAHALHFAPSPIDTSDIFFGTHICKVTFKHLNQLLRSHWQSVITQDNFWKLPFVPQLYHSVGEQGFPQKHLTGGIPIFLSLLINHSLVLGLGELKYNSYRQMMNWLTKLSADGSPRLRFCACFTPQARSIQNLVLFLPHGWVVQLYLRPDILYP
jgi:hypothetical protein